MSDLGTTYQNRPCPSVLALFGDSAPGLVETGSMVVTYSDQLTGAPPHGVVPQCSGLQAAVTPQFCFFFAGCDCTRSGDTSDGGVFLGNGPDI